jgi:hypothetical protein
LCGRLKWSADRPRHAATGNVRLRVGGLGVRIGKETRGDPHRDSSAGAASRAELSQQDVALLLLRRTMVGALDVLGAWRCAGISSDRLDARDGVGLVREGPRTVASVRDRVQADSSPRLITIPCIASSSVAIALRLHTLAGAYATTLVTAAQ